MTSSMATTNQDRDTSTVGVKSNWPTLRPSVEESQRMIDSLYQFINTHHHHSLSNAHTVDFFTSNHWHNVVPERWREEMGPAAVITDDLLHNTDSYHENGSLGWFIYIARSYSIPIVWGRESSVDVSIPDRLVQFGMTAKKSHEVANFSKFVAQLTSENNINQVLDIGSGKGYLSQHLALGHGLNVVGIDAKLSNTQGGQNRNKKVYKAWRSISQTQKPLTKSQSFDCRLTDNDDDITLSDMNLPNLFDQSTLETRSTLEITSDIKSKENDKSTRPEAPSSNQCSLTQGQAPITLQYAEHSATEQSLVVNTSYIPLTQTISTSSSLNGSERLDEDLEQATDFVCDERFSAKLPTCLVGLHTCGDLGGVALRLFLRQPQLHTACVVGCCYQQITEKNEIGCSADSIGFPMSSYLLSQSAILGRTMRMLACQAASRLTAISSGAALESVFRRAVLQVLLQRRYPHFYKERRDEVKVGRMRKPPAMFEEYTYKALEKLGLDSSKVSRKEIAEIYCKFEPNKVHLATFLKLRAVLASCIESLILMDRLLYLQEQETIETVSLVQLFDPLISPRCFAVVATKHKSGDSCEQIVSSQTTESL